MRHVLCQVLSGKEQFLLLTDLLAAVFTGHQLNYSALLLTGFYPPNLLVIS
jgi:hypothetical protein